MHQDFGLQGRYIAIVVILQMNQPTKLLLSICALELKFVCPISRLVFKKLPHTFNCVRLSCGGVVDYYSAEFVLQFFFLKKTNKYMSPFSYEGILCLLLRWRGYCVYKQTPKVVFDGLPYNHLLIFQIKISII